MEAKMQSVSKFEGKVEFTMHSPYPWKILVPAERAKLPSKCKDTSRKMIDCCKLESAAVVQVNTCHDTTHRVGTGDFKAEVELSVIEESRAECPQPDRISEISLPSISNSEYHVLTVDDSKIDQKVIERLLKTSSYKVTTVNSAVRALEYLGLSESCPSPGKANRVSVNLIMTDYCMPEMTGYDLLKIVKASSAFKEVPVIVMSSENDSNRIKSCLAEGAEEFIIKPVQMEDVKRLRGHIRPCTGPSESSNSSIRGKRKSPDGLQPTSPARRARYSGVAVA
jgi:two-component response regulator (ARR-A family)